MVINKLKKLIISLLLSTSLCCCEFIPFKKYANDYDNVIWVSTAASSIDLKIYVLEKDDTGVTFSLCVINKNDKLYYLVAYPSNSFDISIVDDYGIRNCTLTTHLAYLKQNIYKSNVYKFRCNSSEDNYDLFTKDLSISEEDYVEFEMKEFNPKEEANPLMFSNIIYTSETYDFSTTAVERGYPAGSANDTYFVSYGTMSINNVKANVALKFLPENKFFIFRNDKIEDVIISGTYTNNWTDITLNITENKIDDTTTMNVKGEFLGSYTDRK